MNFKEKNIDIFEEYENAQHGMRAMAFCCSGDVKLQAGISQKIDEKYHIEEMMEERMYRYGRQYEAGKAYLFRIDADKVLIPLVNRDKKWQGTTYDEMLACIMALKGLLLEHKIRILIIPKISCGLDMMNWDIIRPIIKEQFEDTDIDITVCYI